MNNMQNTMEDIITIYPMSDLYIIEYPFILESSRLLFYPILFRYSNRIKIIFIRMRVLCIRDIYLIWSTLGLKKIP